MDTNQPWRRAAPPRRLPSDRSLPTAALCRVQITRRRQHCYSPTRRIVAGYCCRCLFIRGVCVACYEFPEGTAFQMKRYADVLTSHHSHTSSVPHVSSSLATLRVLIQPWTTAERAEPVWPPYQGTGTAKQADLAKLGSAQLNPMSLHLTSVCQLPIIEHKIGRHGGRSWKRQHLLDKPHDDDDDVHTKRDLFFLPVCLCVLVTTVNPAKRLNRSRCRLAGGGQTCVVPAEGTRY